MAFFTFDPIKPFTTLVGFKGQPSVPPDIRQQLEELGQACAKPNTSADWLRIYERALAVARSLLTNLAAAASQPAATDTAAQPSEQPTAEELTALENQLKNFLAGLKHKITELQQDLDMENLEAEVKIKKITDAVTVAQQPGSDAIDLVLSADEKKRLQNELTRNFHAFVSTKSAALNNYLTRDKKNALATIDQSLARLHIPSSLKKTNPFTFAPKGVDLSDVTRQIDVPRLLAVFSHSVRSWIMLPTTIAMPLVSIIYAFKYLSGGSGQGPSITGLSIGPYRYLIGAAGVALGLVLLPLEIRRLKRERTRKAARETQAAVKLIKQDLAKDLQAWYKRQAEGFKKALTKFQHDIESRLTELTAALSVLKLKTKPTMEGTFHFQQTSLFSIAPALPDQLQQMIIPQLEVRLGQLREQLAKDEEKRKNPFELQVWLASSPDGQECEASYEGDLKTYKFPLGESIHLYLKSKKSIHLIVLNLEQEKTEGQLVFPNSYHTEDHLLAYIPHVIPDGGKKYPFRWRIVTAGDNRLRAIATTKSILPREFMKGETFTTLQGEELQRFLAALETRMSQLPDSDKQVVELAYSVSE